MCLSLLSLLSLPLSAPCVSALSRPLSPYASLLPRICSPLLSALSLPLESEVRKRAIGLCHAVGVLFFLYGLSLTLGGSNDFFG